MTELLTKLSTSHFLDLEMPRISRPDSYDTPQHEAGFLIRDIERDPADTLRVVATDYAHCILAMTKTSTGLPVDRMRETLASVEDCKRDHYTSPTNIGEYLVALAGMKAMGILPHADAHKLAKQVVSRIEQLSHSDDGFLYAWYDTSSGEVVDMKTDRSANSDPFVPTIDNVWLAASMITAAGAFPELSWQLNALLDRMQLHNLYDSEQQLFYGGRDGATARSPLSNWRLDILRTEAHAAAVVTASRFGIPRANLETLRRADTAHSWGGSRFEEVMGNQFFLSSDPRDVAFRRQAYLGQYDYARQRGLPVLGVSVADVVAMNGMTRYAEMGVPGRGTKDGGLGYFDGENADVIVPYALFQSLDDDPVVIREMIVELRNKFPDMYRQGAGFPDSIRFVRDANGEVTGAVSSGTYLSLDACMAFNALANHLTSNALHVYFAHGLASAEVAAAA